MTTLTPNTALLVSGLDDLRAREAQLVQHLADLDVRRKANIRDRQTTRRIANDIAESAIALTRVRTAIQAKIDEYEQRVKQYAPKFGDERPVVRD